MGLGAVKPWRPGVSDLADWLRAETDHFIIYGAGSERSLRAYAERVERFDFLLRTYYPIRVDHEIPKLEIYLADGARDMRRILPGGSDSIAGFYSADAGRIYTVADIAADPHYQAREMIQHVQMDDGTSLAVPGIIPKLSRTPGSHRRNAPTIGQDTDAVLNEIGLTAAQIQALKDKGIVA